MYELDGEYFAEDVTREFGENRMTGIGLIVVFPLNDYVREHGRNLTLYALDGADICPHCGRLNKVHCGCNEVDA